VSARANANKMVRVALQNSKSLSKALKQHTNEHFQSSTIGVFPTEDESAVAILIVANKYSPNNFW
jgi:capping protein alpha